MIKLILISTLVIFGVNTATEEGMLLEPIHQYIILSFPQRIAKPLMACIYCMSSARTFACYCVLFLANVISLNPIALLVAIPAVCGCITILKKSLRL